MAEPSSPKSSWKRSPALLILLIVLAGGALGAGFYWRRQRQKHSTPKLPPAIAAKSQLPPFGTKEPERYQATRITTSRNSESGSPSAVSTEASRVAISRDGDKRREDYDLEGVGLCYLEVAGARYALLPSQKIYAELNAGEEVSMHADVSAEFSPDRLLNAASSESRYEALGNEVLNGRPATKYRVVITSPASSDAIRSETLIWVDQSLNMPVKSETIVFNNGEQSSFTTELQNLSQSVDAAVFQLPPDYRKVSTEEFEQYVRKAKTEP